MFRKITDGTLNLRFIFSSGAPIDVQLSIRPNNNQHMLEDAPSRDDTPTAPNSGGGGKDPNFLFRAIRRILT